MIVFGAEVERLQVNRNVRRGQVAAQLVGELRLAILGLRVLKVSRRIVAGAIIQLHVVAVQLYRQVPEAAVACGVGRSEPENVVGLGVMLDLLEGWRKIV